MVQIYLYSRYLSYTYAIQKEERITMKLERILQEHTERATSDQNLKMVHEYAVNVLHMQALSLKKIHRIKLP